MIVAGQLAPIDALAEELDAERRTLIHRLPKPDDSSEEEWAETREAFSTLTASVVEERRGRVAQLDDDLNEHGDDWDLRTLPAGLARRVIDLHTRAHLTLREVRIAAPGQVGVTQLAVLRIQLAQVAGWWVLRSDEQGRSSFALWQTDVPGVTRPAE
jgi:hypothetical protein